MNLSKKNCNEMLIYIIENINIFIEELSRILCVQQKKKWNKRDGDIYAPT